MIDRIMKVGMLKQALHKEIVSLSMGLDITFGSRTLFLSRIVDEVLMEAAVRNVRQRHKVSKCCWENSADKYITHRGTTNLQFAKNKQTNKNTFRYLQCTVRYNFKKKECKVKVCRRTGGFEVFIVITFFFFFHFWL